MKKIIRLVLALALLLAIAPAFTSVPAIGGLALADPVNNPPPPVPPLPPPPCPEGGGAPPCG